LLAVALPAYQDYTRRAQVTTGFLLGSEAAKKVGDYYTKQKQGPNDLAVAEFYFTSSQVVSAVDFDRQTGIITITFQDDFFASKSLLLIPKATDGKVNWLCTGTGLDTKYLPHGCRETQDEANAYLGSVEAEAAAKAKAKSDYAQVLATIEARHPELNPDSASHNTKAEAWVVERKKMYDQAGGRSAAVALQQAVTDYAAALQRNQESQSNIQGASIRPQARPYTQPTNNPNATVWQQSRDKVKNCEIQAVMTDDDYRACGLNPPQNKPLPQVPPPVANVFNMKDKGGHSGYPGNCRWLSSSEWSCQ
jgi:type IV pilus assembly protein PilA